MHFTNIVSLLAVAATTVTAIASPNGVDHAPQQVGRRLSRKAIQRRHWHHHHHQSDSASQAADPTVDGSSPVPEPTTTDDGSADDGSDCDTPEVVTVYTTITMPAAASPTDSESPAPTDGTPTSSDAPVPSGSNAPSNDGAVIQATGSQCGDPNAVPQPAPTSGPNGDENWINCGVDGAGWVPPPITLDNLVYRDLAVVLTEDGNPFSACSPYLSMFQDMESQTGIPTIFLASIALQESGCNPTVTGGAGEIGMMQITGEKCPQDGDCYDAATNIRIGAEYFKTVLETQCNNNVACTMGAYNGWQPGLTVASANNYAICAQHNNLDYLHYVFNWFLQGKAPTAEAGIYHNTC